MGWRKNQTKITFQNELKKAILLSSEEDAYNSYQTFLQYLATEQRLIEYRIRVCEQKLREFGQKGGKIETSEDGTGMSATMGETSYNVTFDSEGNVTSYNVQNPNGDGWTELHLMFYCTVMLERLKHALTEIIQKRQFIDNDRLLKALGRVGEHINEDVYLTTGGLTGNLSELRTDETPDPYSIFGHYTGEDDTE